jgi:hypothetical protein
MDPRLARFGPLEKWLQNVSFQFIPNGRPARYALGEVGPDGAEDLDHCFWSSDSVQSSVAKQALSHVNPS